MNVNDLMQLLEDSEATLSHILKDCTNNPDEVSLLSSKMGSLLEDFSTLRKELHSKYTDQESSQEPDDKLGTQSSEE